jgi:23S rRNA (guanosine2251-2'-O)-methyltransferase
MSAELFIRNPHSILQALKARPKDVIEISLPKEKQDGVWDLIESLAEKNRVRMIQSGGASSARPQHGGKPQGRNPRHQKPQANFVGRESGHGAVVKPKSGISLEEMFEGIDGDSRGVWLALDCLQDPQNLGAIFRSAAFFGIRGIIMTTERSAPMTATVYDISSGGVETVPMVQTINLKQALDKAKDAGLWILGTSEHAKEPIQKIAKDRPWLVVMGNEEKGIRRLTEESCDVMCAIPPKGEGVTSLNVSVATGILLAHLS